MIFSRPDFKQVKRSFYRIIMKNASKIYIYKEKFKL